MRGTTPVCYAALAAGVALAAPASSAPPDFNGTWVFVQQRSDDLREKIDGALGPDSTSGDGKKDSARAWIRTWLVGLTETPDPGVLTIEQTPAEFRSGTGDDLRLYSFERARTRQNDGGVLCRATVRWEGDKVVVEERAEKGSGYVREVYTLEPGGRDLVVDWSLEHKSLRHPLVLRLAFQRQ
jgi:hypothetical protein